jgi:hypothetical protein
MEYKLLGGRQNKSRDRFIDGRIVMEVQYDPEGNPVNEVDFLETTAYQIKSMPDIVTGEAVMKGGLNDGPMTWYHQEVRYQQR